MQNSATAAQYQYMTTSPDFCCSLDANKVMKFEQRPKPPLYKAFSVLMQSMATAFKSPLPRQTHWYIRQMPSYRNADRMKNELIRRQTEESLTRIERGDEQQRCAIDNILQREAMSAAKAGREPDYYSVAIRDEVSLPIRCLFLDLRRCSYWAFF